MYYGNYPKSSYRKLEPNELKKMSKSELAIMRNEIYVRYGYIFIKNGKMDQYFRKQDWYHAEHKNVDRFLNEIEIYNI
nr:YARHG domain-containing protein [uncultured Nonlabens sp.]